MLHTSPLSQTCSFMCGPSAAPIHFQGATKLVAPKFTSLVTMTSLFPKATGQTPNHTFAPTYYVHPHAASQQYHQMLFANATKTNNNPQASAMTCWMMPPLPTNPRCNKLENNAKLENNGRHPSKSETQSKGCQQETSYKRLEQISQNTY